MKQLFSTWWSTKSAQEQADLESSFSIFLDGFTFLPALLIVCLL
ncbi:hypothetical protein [Thalassotalea fusca]